MLFRSVPNKVQLGPHLTQGLGAGANPMIGRQATEESLEEIKNILAVNTKMAFITAGMGGGTGTGGAPIIAQICKDMGILTVGIVTTPFAYEGKKRLTQAEEGINFLKENVDTLLVISNDKMREVYGNLKLTAAFAHADSVLANAARSIAEIITVPGYVNVDFEDVNTVMRQSGVAIMGTSIGEGENRAQEAIEDALNSPLLNDNDIRGAKNILLNVTSGEDEVTLDEITSITDYIQTQAGFDTNIIWGNCNNPSLGNKIAVTVIATGFESKGFFKNAPAQKKTTLPLEDKNEVQYNSDGAIIEINKPEQMPPAAVEESEKEKIGRAHV